MCERIGFKTLQCCPDGMVMLNFANIFIGSNQKQAACLKI